MPRLPLITRIEFFKKLKYYHKGDPDRKAVACVLPLICLRLSVYIYTRALAHLRHPNHALEFL